MAVVSKVFLIDIPAIGEKTVQCLNGGIIALEAGRLSFCTGKTGRRTRNLEWNSRDN